MAQSVSGDRVSEDRALSGCLLGRLLAPPRTPDAPPPRGVPSRVRRSWPVRARRDGPALRPGGPLSLSNPSSGPSSNLSFISLNQTTPPTGLPYEYQQLRFCCSRLARKRRLSRFATDLFWIILIFSLLRLDFCHRTPEYEPEQLKRVLDSFNTKGRNTHQTLLSTLPAQSFAASSLLPWSSPRPTHSFS